MKGYLAIKHHSIDVLSTHAESEVTTQKDYFCVGRQGNGIKMSMEATILVRLKCI